MDVNKPKCTIDGCNNNAVSKGYYKGKKKYAKFCTRHLELRSGIREKKQAIRRKWKYGSACIEDVSSCQLCGWNKTNCDVHRIKHGKDGGKYEEGNTIVVCPNCHRAIHRGVIKL